MQPRLVSIALAALVAIPALVTIPALVPIPFLGHAEGPPVALAAPPPRAPAAVILDVEIVETPPGKSASTVKLSLAVAGERPSTLTTSSPAAQYEVTARVMDSKERGHELTLDLERSTRAPTGAGDSVEVSTTSRVVANKRVVLADLTRPDGSRFQVAATVR